jgi:uncharacterized protein (TIGR03437 family)
VPGGGGTSTGGNIALTGSIGQGVLGTSNGGSFSLSGGFWAGVANTDCQAITITPATLSNGQIGQPYVRQLAQAGGVGAVSWTMSSGSLPSNITLNLSTGLLSGTPLVSGSFPFTVKATDTGGCEGSQAYTLVIGNCPIITIAPGALPSGIVGVVYDQALSPSGGAPPYTFSMTSGLLPPGLSLSASGVISGTPSAAASFGFTVRVTDANGCTGASNYTLVVNSNTFAVSGRVTDGMGSGIAAVAMTFTQAPGGTDPRPPVQTDANGNWTQTGFAVPPTPSACAASPFRATPTSPGFLFTPPFLTFCAPATNLNFLGVPAVTSVSAASFLGPELAPESIVAAFGTALATETLSASGLPLPTTIAGTTVRLRDSAGIERLAPLFFVSRDQINYLVPAGTATGVGVVTVVSGDGKLSIGGVQIAAVAPGVFAANSNGRGVAAAQALRVRGGMQTFEPVAQFNTAQGQYVPLPLDLGPENDQVFLILFGTGIRGRTGLAAVTVTIGGVLATVSFAGAQGGFVGVDQANVLIPRSLIGRDQVDVVLTVDGKTANTLRIATK